MEKMKIIFIFEESMNLFRRRLRRYLLVKQYKY
jgi:hypothetical protein